MIIYGWKQYARLVAVLVLVCQQCSMPAEHGLRKWTTKVTLFFIPLFPIARKYTLQCGACQHEVKIPKDQADRLVMSASAPPQPQPQPQPAYGPPPGWQGPPQFQQGPPPPMPMRPPQQYGPPPGYHQGPPPPMRPPYPPQQYPPPNPYGR